ncbi:DUF6241 domain-containing protein [Halobacillus sp. K22]|uniref:DUF6241 domain-containing protein n=1 Tax=Halobacillus sp. K22 TaxID=3457431 RepID=UPI003FCE0DF6
MKKIMGYTLLVTLLLAGAGVWAVQKYVLTAAEDNKDISPEALRQAEEVITGAISEEELDSYKEAGKNPFGKDTPAEELTDYHYKEYIHGMSHQKVKASKKWGFYEIHPERISWLLKGLEQADVEHKQVYKNILVKWEEGNFSTIDEDHNAIWNLQNGTIGKATGILSPTEEKDYIEGKK